MLTLLPGTDAHPPRKATDKRHTNIPRGARAAACAPESEIKVDFLRLYFLKESYFLPA